MRANAWWTRGVLLACVALPSPSTAASVEADVATAPAPKEVRQTYARVALSIGDRRYAHPGFFAYVGEEALFDFEIGGKVHEVAVGIQGDEEKGYDLDVIYKKEAALLLDGKGHVTPGGSLALVKGEVKVEVFIDPHGQVEKGRKKKIGGPDSEDPLG